MGRVTETLEITVSVSNHNSQQDIDDREALNRLRWMIRKDISEVCQDNPNLRVLTSNLDDEDLSHLESYRDSGDTSDIPRTTLYPAD